MHSNDSTGAPQLDEAGYVYFIENPERRSIKIGFSKDVDRRLKDLDATQGALRLIGYFPGTRRTEQWVHAKFHVDRKSGEWFRASVALRSFVQHLGLVGSKGYGRKRNLDLETATSDAELVAKLMEIARGEVRRYLHRVITAAVPEWGSQDRRDRIKAALARAKAAGIKVGRPRASVSRQSVIELRASGLSIRQIASRLNIGLASVHRMIHEVPPDGFSGLMPHYRPKPGFSLDAESVS